MKVKFAQVAHREYEVTIETEGFDQHKVLEGAFLSELLSMLFINLSPEAPKSRLLTAISVKNYPFKTWAGECVDQVKLLFKC